MLKVDTFKQYAKFGLNVLLTGDHGVGKTAMIKEVFNDVFGDMNKKWLYFSASTLDPWVDFVGVPDPYTKENGERVFRIIPPEHLTGDEGVEAMFFDEINRADDKTLNAIMELIQFKSINGRRFPNLKVIWAAQNPSDENKYSVGELDPAQMDRFQVQVMFPLELNRDYMVNIYGETVFNCAQSFWENRKKKISPRKLCDILNAHMMGFDISDFAFNVDLTELKNALSNVGDIENMISIAKDGSVDKIKRYFTIDRIRKNEVLLNTRSNKKQIFSNIYEHMPEEIRSYINETFNYIHVNVKNESSHLTESKIEFLNNFSNICEMESGHTKEFFGKIEEINKHFNYKDIMVSQILDNQDMKKLVLISDETDGFEIENGFFTDIMGGDLCDAQIAEFRDYMKLMISVGSEIQEDETREYIHNWIKNMLKNSSKNVCDFNVTFLLTSSNDIKNKAKIKLDAMDKLVYVKLT